MITTPLRIVTSILLLLTFLSGCVGNDNSRQSDYYNKGVGIYPGNPAESYAPVLQAAGNEYRNVALHRKAYHSSSYDYNLTAQLVTDGIVAASNPSTIRVSTNAGELKKNEREWLFDGKSDSKYTITGSDIFLRLDLNNISLAADKIIIAGAVSINDSLPKGYEISISASRDGVEWETLSEEKGSGYAGKPTPSFRFPWPPPPPPVESPKPVPAVTYLYDYAIPTTPPRMDMSVFGGMNQGRQYISHVIRQEIALKSAAEYNFYKISCRMPAAVEWQFNEWEYYLAGEPVDVLPSFRFQSAWQSAGAGEEWVYVDLGAPAGIDKIKLHWLNRAHSGSIQTSADAKTWTEAAQLTAGSELSEEISLGKTVRAQYVRLLMTAANDQKPYILSEMEVYGKGGLIPQPHPEREVADGRKYLSGGNWRLQRISEAKAAGEAISQAGYDASGWIPATVPGTVLSSYINIGAVPDPNYADNQLQISESFFLSNFWYRNEFTLPDNFAGKNVFLNFEGVNWKANVFLNGQKAGHIESGFMRGRFNISNLLASGTNVLAVEIVKNEHPGAIKEQTAFSADQNGGFPGADNPTFHATIGWDWIPTIRGRDIGIWNDVYITQAGPVSITDPFVRTELPLPDTTYAFVLVEATLTNASPQPVTGILEGSFGEAEFRQEITLEGSETLTVSFDHNTHQTLEWRNPRLWWPKGYGSPHLYDVNLTFTVDGQVSDRASFKSGVRQMTYTETPYVPNGPSFGFWGGEPKRLSLYINGRRFIGFGGNWGFGESNLNYRAREYDIAVAYHADMNFTMIRNWVGQIGDEEFYEACDRHGIMVWQDFWLANPVDGPNPYYPDIFNSTATDFIKRIRNHPSIGIYVGRNEGDPPPAIDNYLRETIPYTHPGIHYISNSSSGVVSGGGPYRALPPRTYFSLYGHDQFHSERGMPNVMTYESMLQTYSPEAMEYVNTTEQPNAQWGMHDYTLNSAQGAASFNQIIEKAFGKPQNVRQFSEWAQWINYDGYRAIFEGRSENRRGMLLWMSHPAWPSMVWQTYDYYFDPTGAYFGCKKASEPVHIQWNPIRNDIEVVNYHGRDRSKLTAKAQLINQDGTVQWEKEIELSVKEDETVACFPLEYPESLSETYFIKLWLTEGESLVSDNFYWRGKEEGNYQSLHQLPKVSPKVATSMSKEADEWTIVTTITNESATPLLMLRLSAAGSGSGQRILPAFFTDNYFSLMPGESRTVTVRLSDRDTRGEKPRIGIEGFNKG
ncbi:MAG: discoidin domain-containing protein [Tannerellaceae bacterium]|jgi:hypothetical protein|nr:discoidin domain-containing protein [Tannerellaceae bacterium]